MGEAKKRGTFEQRKAQAIAEGREKKPKMTAHERKQLEYDFMQSLIPCEVSKSYLDLFAMLGGLK